MNFLQSKVQPGMRRWIVRAWTSVVSALLISIHGWSFAQEEPETPPTDLGAEELAAFPRSLETNQPPVQEMPSLQSLVPSSRPGGTSQLAGAAPQLTPTGPSANP